MRDEQILIIAEELTQGLRKDSRTFRNSKTLASVRNLRPFPSGLKPIPSRQRPFTSVAVNWPFPQVFRGQTYTLLADETALYWVDNVLALNAITTYDAYDTAAVLGLTAGGCWQLMDFGEFFMLFNGNCTAFRSNAAAVTGVDDKVFVQSAVTINAGTAFRGRGIIGGFNSSDFWRDEWKSLWNAWADVSGTAIDTSQGIGENYVWWSSIGGGDILWLFYPEQAESGITGVGFDSDDPLFLRRMKQNQMGFMPMPWQGSVLAIKPLGNGIMVYGENGVTYLPHIAAPVPTFGMVDLAIPGIKGRGAVAGNEREHVFVDTIGYIWRITEGPEADRLGYQEFLTEMSSDVMVSHDLHENDYYISDGETGYVLTGSGLAEVKGYPTSIVSIDGLLYEVGIGSYEQDLYLETDILDFGERFSKTIHTVEVGLSAPGDVSASVLYRDDKGQLFVESTWTTLDDSGIFVPVVTGTDFKLALRATNATDVEIDYIKVWWSVSCKQDVGSLLDS